MALTSATALAAPGTKENNMTTSAMTSTQAIKHMAATLTGAIAQSKQPGFVEKEAYADIVTNYELVKAQCTDLATVVWLKARYCAGYIGDEYTFEDINLPHLKSLEHVLATGYRPGSYSALNMKLSNMFEMDWWEAKNIVVTKRDGDNIYGTATVDEVEGDFQITFEWLMETGEKAAAVDLPAIISITAGRVTVPYEFSLVETDGTPLDTLEALQEMDCVLGWSADIFNNVYNALFPAEGKSQQG